MPIRRNGLGKGLDSLIPDKNSKSGKNESKSDKVLKKEMNYSEEEQKDHQKRDAETDLSLNEEKKSVNSEGENKGELFLNINEVEPNRSQPRKEFDEDALLELADSIKQYGVLQPLIVQMACCKTGGTKRSACYYKRIYKTGNCRDISY